MSNHEVHEGHEGLLGITMRGFVFLVCFVVSVLVLARPGALLAQMDLTQVSGQPLPSPDLPAGTITFRVIRGSLANNIAGQTVDITVDGQVRQLKTDAEGRVQVDKLAQGTRVKAVTVVGDERVESKDITIGDSGIRVMLVAGVTSGGAAGGAAAAPVAGAVMFGPESRVVAEFADDRLSVYFLMEVVNPGSAPVDTGGPLIIELPRTARGATALPDSTKQATVNVDHVIVTGPFPPGKIPVRVAFELPAPGGTARVSAKIPAPLPQVIVIAGQTGGVDLISPQITAKRNVTDQGQPIVVGTGPALQAGQMLEFDITGLPHRAAWPQYVALGIAGAFVLAGIWGAATARRR